MLTKTRHTVWSQILKQSVPLITMPHQALTAALARVKRLEAQLEAAQQRAAAAQQRVAILEKRLTAAAQDAVEANAHAGAAEAHAQAAAAQVQVQAAQLEATAKAELRADANQVCVQVQQRKRKTHLCCHLQLSRMLILF